MIALPLISERPPLVRVLVADSFGNTYSVGSDTSAGGGPWINLPMLSEIRGGFELMDGMTRPTLPEIGECRLRIRFGVIDGKVYGLSAGAVQSIQQTGSWDADTDLLEVPSLEGKEIRVQLCPDDGEDTWRTVWWGSCEYETDSEWPGASLPVGERICHCYDGLYRTKRWYMTQHAAYISGSQYLGAPGHPGYNVGLDGKVLGNRETTGAAWEPFPDSDPRFFMHTWQGTGIATFWTDQQAAEAALRVSRPEGEPQFCFSGSTTLLSTGASPWPIVEGEPAFDVLTRICARERGRGAVQVAWTDDVADPTGPLVVFLKITPQTKDPITYIDVPNTGHTATIPGALAAGTTVAVDLIGDHRAMPAGFERSKRAFARFDGVETVGERIQVLITASRYDGSTLSLEDRWSTADRTAFLALDFTERKDERWRAVGQSYGLPREWQGLAKDHNNGAQYAQHRVDYRLSDAGAILVPTGAVDTSPLLVKVLPDTPLLEGYVYSGATPARRDAATETGEPDRRPPAVWIRTAANRYDYGDGLCIHVKQDSLWVTHSGDDTSGARYISDTTVEAFGATYSTAQLGVTLALELPHRLRFKTLSTRIPASGLGLRSVKRVEVPDAHLWLASPGAIWDLDGATANADGFTPSRAACGGTLTAPGILRDDRARVAVLHALACAWYLVEHRPTSWTLRACGLLPSFGTASADDTEIEATGTQTYPTLGQLVTTLAANGQTVEINAPITGIIYNHQSQTSTWSCDWVDLDVR